MNDKIRNSFLTLKKVINLGGFQNMNLWNPFGLVEVFLQAYGPKHSDQVSTDLSGKIENLRLEESDPTEIKFDWSPLGHYFWKKRFLLQFLPRDYRRQVQVFSKILNCYQMRIIIGLFLSAKKPFANSPEDFVRDER